MPVRARRQRPSAPAPPQWVVTFGDMMALLLCFFILLQSFSELRQEREYQRVITAVKEAFGYAGSVGVLPVDDTPLTSIVEVLERMAIQRDSRFENQSESEDPGVDGEHVRVTRIREGIVFTVGGPSTFDELSAEVRPEMREHLEHLAALLAGRNNKIDVVGHSAMKYLPDGSRWRSLDELSFERAENVKTLLVEAGLPDDVFRLQAAGTREPLRSRAVNSIDAADNRRVDIILTEVLVEERNKDARYTDETAARGG